MSNQKGIAIISTFAKDCVTFLDEGKTEIKRGGPAFWIERVLKRNKVPYYLVLGDHDCLVEVEIQNGQPLPGKIKNLATITLSEPLVADATIISPLLDEFDLNQVSKIHGTVAVDVAGYTRAGKWGQGIQNVPTPSEDIRSKIEILKANDREYACLADDWTEEQKKNRILLLTHGKDGLDLWDKGEQMHFKAPDAQPKNVLGSGDTFITAFVISYLRHKSARQACVEATQEVKELFLEKIKEENAA